MYTITVVKPEMRRADFKWGPATTDPPCDSPGLSNMHIIAWQLNCFV